MSVVGIKSEKCPDRSSGRNQRNPGKGHTSKDGGIRNFDAVDFPAIGNLIIGGNLLLVLRSRSVDTYSGINRDH